MNYDGKFDNDFSVACQLGQKLLSTLNKKLKAGHKMIHTEILKESIAMMLDKHSGIDAIMLSGAGDISGVALRIQTCSEKNWQTFTIRNTRANGTKTEYEKRLKQIYDAHPSFYPHFTCQAYFDKTSRLIGGGLCYTKTIFDAIKNNLDNSKGVYMQTNKSDGNTFIVVPFSMIDPIMIF